jgi:hypothetical protein
LLVASGLVAFIGLIVGLMVALALYEPSHCPNKGVEIADRCGQLLFEPELINHRGVDAVVLARIAEVKPARWTTFDGTLPKGTTAFENGIWLYTPVVVDVLEDWKGAPGQRSITVLSSGGTEKQTGCTDVACGQLRGMAQGSNAVVLLSRSERELNLGQVWEEVWVLPVKNDEVSGTSSCETGSPARCANGPIAQFKARMLDALATGRPYPIPRSTQGAPQ